VALADGRAVFRMADLKSAPAIVANSFYLANGITMDRDEKTLFVPKLC
jgi:sugar lactone lactonase YvrE